MSDGGCNSLPHSVQCPYSDSLITEDQRQGATFEALTTSGGNSRLGPECSIQAAPVLSISVLPGPSAQETLLSLSSAWTPDLYPPRVCPFPGTVHATNPGPICSGVLRAFHLYDSIYNMSMLLNISEPQFPPLKSKVNNYYFGWQLQRRKKITVECLNWLPRVSANMTVFGLLGRPAPLNWRGWVSLGKELCRK